MWPHPPLARAPPTLRPRELRGAGPGRPLAPDPQAEKRPEKGKGRVGAWQHCGLKPGRKVPRNCRAGKWRGLGSITRKEGDSEADRGRAGGPGE